MPSKLCIGPCGIEKDIEEFSPDNRASLEWKSMGRQARCRACCASWQNENPSFRREGALKFKYGLIIEDYDRMSESQGHVCAICGDVPRGKKKYLCVDHDHSCCPSRRSCGKCLRELICDTCNKGLGQFKESVEILNKAIDYINKHKSKVDAKKVV